MEHGGDTGFLGAGEPGDGRDPSMAFWEEECRKADERFYATHPRAQREREIVRRREERIRAFLAERGDRPIQRRVQLSAVERFRILKRCDFACTYCGRRPPEVALEIDHIRPIAKGGSNDEDNLTAACRDCNRGKSAMLLDGDN